MPEVICNTSPIQYLYQAGLLDVLRQLYGTVLIPESVLMELDAGRALGISLPDMEALPWFRVQSVEAKKLLEMVSGLGEGEKEVLALSLEKPQSLAILDDRLGRRYASFLGIQFTGTLGVLLKAKEEGLLTILTPILDRMEALRFCLDPQTRKAVLDLAKE